ncbi:MAG: DUF3467 domain-containing protein [Candidatus Bathyarchaeota archaeon]|nr:DUF3467 domain-containing protein [Candidatus Bathyarchaeota archaeon]
MKAERTIERRLDIQIKMRDDLEPVFSNFANINHKDDVFTFTFCHMFPIPARKPIAKGTAKAVATMTPQHAKRFLNALSDNIRKYEQRFGEIKLAEEKKTKEGLYV